MYEREMEDTEIGRFRKKENQLRRGERGREDNEIGRFRKKENEIWWGERERIVR